MLIRKEMDLEQEGLSRLGDNVNSNESSVDGFDSQGMLE